MTQRAPQDQRVTAAPTLDPSVPSPARMWNYWVGGKDHFAADRDAATRIIEAMPAMPQLARNARLFLADAVSQLVGLGVRQFLDIGTGLPTANNTHEVAQAAAPESRIVYVDYDPVVLAHARALLTSSPEGKTDYIEADLRDPDTILAAAQHTLDFTQPVAILLIGVLHFIPDSDEPYGLVDRLMAALPPGSYLTIGHGASDIQPAEAAELTRRYNARSSAQIRMRNRDEVARFFAGLEMTTPGPVPLSEWLPPGKVEVGTASDLAGYCGIGRKP
ncbi:MAG TPA: SAM-dependent methyltransferase [Streptosporangiaceae bacterium]